MRTHLEHGELHGYTTCGHKCSPDGAVPSVLWAEREEVTCKVCRGSRWWSRMLDISERAALRELEYQRLLQGLSR